MAGKSMNFHQIEPKICQNFPIASEESESRPNSRLCQQQIPVMDYPENGIKGGLLRNCEDLNQNCCYWAPHMEKMDYRMH